MSDIGQWFKNLPLFTRHWLGLTLAFSLLGRFGLLKPEYLYLLYDKFVNELQIWRPLTAVFYYPLNPATGFHFMINCYFLYNYSLRLETGAFQGKPADYFFMLLFNWACCIIISLFKEMPLLMDPMVLSVLYIWCQLNRDAIVNFWFGTRFPAMYLPWVLLGVNLVLSGGGFMELSGILIGHLYFFLMYKYPEEYGGAQLLTTPNILKQYFPETRGGVYSFVGNQNIQRPAAPAAPAFGGHRWGPGQPLGGN
uniref:Derlin n=1 Tax=Xenopsylla cheopis TaxID=163159 RepID=A0A6M2DY61_XENCH